MIEERTAHLICLVILIVALTSCSFLTFLICLAIYFLGFHYDRS
jgi:hypothetical protein